MCIVQGAVRHIAKTRILVSPLSSKLQLTVYANTVELGENSGAMILPTPEGKVEPVDLSKEKKLFDDLETLWPRKKSRSRNAAAKNDRCLSRSVLPVVEVGSYQVTIVPSLADFDRVDSSVFTLSPGVGACLKDHYESGFSFVVCQLVREKEYHPFGYIHNRLDDNTLFVPTRHYHKHDV